ncbi:hypothetical protein CYMTET_13506 [Cymbomonas tetramitiformis]|uniref:Uncharacterized protein n=1 Tax=Cymbomonas tetramitiformis TaxID=36881 RepID=A0AAE0LAT8_9CHLO|nr:hypothetical protein CYMTET_13506 [Cymbomonas tetramitiformis]
MLSGTCSVSCHAHATHEAMADIAVLGGFVRVIQGQVSRQVEGAPEMAGDSSRWEVESEDEEYMPGVKEPASELVVAKQAWKELLPGPNYLKVKRPPQRKASKSSSRHFNGRRKGVPPPVANGGEAIFVDSKLQPDFPEMAVTVRTSKEVNTDAKPGTMAARQLSPRTSTGRMLSGRLNSEHTDSALEAASRPSTPQQPQGRALAASPSLPTLQGFPPPSPLNVLQRKRLVHPPASVASTSSRLPSPHSTATRPKLRDFLAKNYERSLSTRQYGRSLWDRPSEIHQVAMVQVKVSSFEPMLSPGRHFNALTLTGTAFDRFSMQTPAAQSSFEVPMQVLEDTKSSYF